MLQTRGGYNAGPIPLRAAGAAVAALVAPSISNVGSKKAYCRFCMPTRTTERWSEEAYPTNGENHSTEESEDYDVIHSPADDTWWATEGWSHDDDTW